jgi:hypothetical protein
MRDFIEALLFAVVAGCIMAVADVVLTISL